MIGGLRYQIELLAQSRAADEAGGGAVSWAPAATLWSAVDLLPSITSGAGQRRRRARRIKAFVRNRTDFALGGRIRFDGADFEIVSIEPDDERGRRVFLICEEAEK